MKTAQIAKIARPKLSGIVKRERLFGLLDHGKQKSIIWLAAQGGSGKTTLVADWLDARKLHCLWYQVDEGDADIASFFYYMGIAAKHAAPRYKTPLPLLTPEYLPVIPVFTRRYFEELFSRLKAPAVVVLDNYQEVALASGFHDMVANGLDTIPEGITVVILSRAAPPPQFARLKANNRLHTMGWDEIRFTREESADLLGPQANGKLSVDALSSLYDKTEGWAAGLIMLTAGAGMATTEPAADMTADKLFDYFAGEIFSKTDTSIQEVLLKTSVLQKIDPVIAGQLTGNPMAGQILARLSRNHYFTQQYEQTYQYHPLFRAFLLAQLRQDFAPAQLAHLQAGAATLLAAAGQIEEAADLYCAARDWPALTRLILAHAGQLMTQGRSHTVMQWLNQIPPQIRDADGWLLYWFGLCGFAMQPGLSRIDFERAYAHFEQRDDVTGLYLAWAGILDTYAYEWGDFRPVDHWIDVLESLRNRHPVFPSAEIEARVAGGMLNALVWRKPWHPGLAAWEARVSSIVFSDVPVALRTMLGNHAVLYHLWMGDIAKASVIIETLHAAAHSTATDPLTRLTWYVMASMHAWFVAEHDKCLACVAEGLQLAETTSVHLLDIYLMAQAVYSSVAANQRATAEEYLCRISQQPIQRLMDKSLYFYQAASVAWLQNDMPRCNEYSRIAIDLAEQTGSALPDALCRIEFASVLFNQGNYDEAAEQLDHALALGRGISGPPHHSKSDRSKLPGKGMNLIDFMGGIAEANWALRRGETGRAVELLRDVLARGARQGYVNFPRWHAPTMSRLCALALEHDIEVDYVKRMIRLHDLAPDTKSPVVENWPYRIRISALGQFSLSIADEPLRSSGKQQRKPYELLQLLVSAGQRGLPLEQVVDTLWPGMDSDKAYNAYTSTVYRVRKLVGSEDAVLTHEGRVMLNPSRCYVDAWAFEHLAGQAARLRGTAPDEAARLLKRAIGAYQGSFLNDEQSEEWAIGYRERLHGQFVRAVLDVGHHLEGRRDFGQALDTYQRGLERDDLIEAIYQRILVCCHELGRRAEGLAAFEQCRRRLQRVLDVAPSAQTIALRDQLQHENATLHKSMEEATRIAAIAFGSHEGMMVTDANSMILRVNDAFTKITGYTEQEAVGKTPRLLGSGRQDADFYAAMWESIHRSGAWHGEIWNRRKNGEEYPEQLAITSVKGDSGVVTHYVAMLSDITQRKAAESEIHNLAFYDALTRLPNRRLLNDRLGQNLAAGKRSACYGAVVFLDLDNFKTLNDTHGHEAGDLLLIEAARRIGGCVREADTVARFGGDEFVVLLGELDADKAKSAEQAAHVAEKIRAMLAEPYVLALSQQRVAEHRCTSSIGVALFANHQAAFSSGPEDILKQADSAMYQAKKKGRNAICFWMKPV